MKNEFRYYKDIIESLKKPHMEENIDYIVFLTYDTDTNDIAAIWFTTILVAGEASSESILRGLGWKDINWNHIIDYKNEVLHEVQDKGFAAIEDFMKWSSKVNCFQWVKVEE